MRLPTRANIEAVAAQAVGKALAVGAWTVLIAWAARGLPADDYGQFMFLANLVLLALLLGSFGLPQVILHLNGRLASNVRTAQHHAGLVQCGRTLMLTSIVAAVGAGIAVAITVHIGPFTFALAIAVAVWVFSAVLQAFLAEEAKTVFRFWTSGLFSNTGAAGGATTLCFAIVGLAALYQLGKEPISLLMLVCVLATGSGLSALFLVGRYWRDVSKRIAVGMGAVAPAWDNKQIRRAGLLVALNGAMAFVIGLSDLWWAAYAVGVKASGQYATANFLARFCSLGGILLSAAFSARFAGLLGTGQQAALSTAVGKLAVSALLSASLVGVGLFTAYKFNVLEAAFRLTDPEALMALVWLSMGHILGSVFGFGPVILAAAGDFRALLIITTFAAMLTTGLAALAVTFGDLATLGMAYAAGYVAFTYACHRWARRVHHLQALRLIFRQHPGAGK